MPVTLDDSSLWRSVVSDQCWRCKHLLRTGDKRLCRAFPEGIPDVIWDETFDHRRPFDGDRGIRFEPLPGMRSPFEEGE